MRASSSFSVSFASLLAILASRRLGRFAHRRADQIGILGREDLAEFVRELRERFVADRIKLPATLLDFICRADEFLHYARDKRVTVDHCCAPQGDEPPD